VFYCFNDLIIDNAEIVNLPILDYSNEIYKIEKKSSFKLEVTLVPSYMDKLLALSKNLEMQRLFVCWKSLNVEQLIELNNLKDEYLEIKQNERISMTVEDLQKYLEVK